MLRMFLCLLFVLVCFAAPAQRILYSGAVRGSFLQRFTVAGKTGGNYWVHKEQSRRNIRQEFFDVYNTRLDLLNTVPAGPIDQNTLKKYMVCGNHFFDELILSAAQQKTNLQLRRYTAEGALVADRFLTNLPFNETGNAFVLTTSADQTKILLLGFEPVTESAPKLHAILFDDNWKIIYSHVYAMPFLTQPFIQDDFFCFTTANGNIPVQLANNGEWLMASPSRTNNNYLLLHFNGKTADLNYKEIKMPPQYDMEDISLYVNNEKGEAFAGILSNYRLTSHKNVHVIHYSFLNNAFDFDSSYRFSTLAGIMPKESNLVKESFIAVPEMGFVLLKEYGRNFNSWYQNNYDLSWNTELLFTNADINNAPANISINANGYSRYNNSMAAAAKYSRGDLSLFYFPGRAADSCWSGFINKKQITELNAPTLSYLFVPLEDQLVLMYNSMERDDAPFGITLSLDSRGNQLSERELISWKSDQSLIFQQAVKITANEIAIPYERNQQKGFAIVKF